MCCCCLVIETAFKISVSRYIFRDRGGNILNITVYVVFKIKVILKVTFLILPSCS